MEWSEELSGGLLRAVPDAILVLDQGRIALINDRAETMFGWSRADLLGQPAAVVLPDQAPDRISVTARRRDGSEFPAEAALSPVDTPDGPLVVAVVRDRTAEQRTRRQLDHLSDDLAQLAGGSAHDFNNLLGVIGNYAQFVIEEAASAEPDLTAIGADAQQVVKAGERGTALTQQMLTYARRDPVEPRLLDLNAVIAGAENTLRDSLGERISLTVSPGAGLSPIMGDPGQVERLLTLLAGNAREAMPDGGSVVIDTGAQRHDAADYLRLRVRDSGAGMADDVRERAFEPFFSTKAGGTSAGLGLPTVYGIVARAGGSVTIASHPGQGTTVSVLLPVGAERG